MADPATMTMAVTAISAVATAAGTVVSARGEADATKKQAPADQQRATFEAQQAQRQATEERAAAQKDAFEENRQTRLLKSRLGAVAGASGSGVTDAGVTTLLEGIDRQGSTNAQRAMASGDQKAQSMIYQANLNRWGADMNARIKRSAARSTLIGGSLKAAGDFGSSVAGLRLSTPMGAKYGSGAKVNTGYGT